MRKWTSRLIRLALLLLLLGLPLYRFVTNFVTLPPEAFPAIRWKVTIESEDIHGVTWEYSVNRVPLGGITVSRDPGATQPFSVGDHLICEIPDSVLPEDWQKSGCTIGFTASVTLPNGQESLIPVSYEWAPTPYKLVHFTLSGSETDGFTLTPIESIITQTPT